jgi:hypothetical protein
MPRLDKPRVDGRGEAGELQLRTAVRQRGEIMMTVGTMTNAPGANRTLPLLPLLMHFGGHLTPCRATDMNTGAAARRIAQAPSDGKLNRFECAENPFAAKALLPMSSV